MPNYIHGTPDNCPDAIGANVNGTIYRACDTNPPTAEDFTSHAHSLLPRKRRRCDPTQCESWGLSVWTSEADALHAKRMHEWLGKKFIFKADVQPADGRLAQTGKDPTHHTYWRYDTVDLVTRSTLVAV